MMQCIVVDSAKDIYPTLQPSTIGSAGLDLKIDRREYGLDGILTIYTGLKIWLGQNSVCGLVVPRSSAPLVLANTVGVIDSDYQGEIVLKSHNIGSELERGDRVAQLLIVQVKPPYFAKVNEFSETTQRGSGGFGSTGIK